MRIIYIIIYGILAIIILSMFEDYLNTASSICQGIIGIGTGIVCIILTEITDDIVTYRRY